MPRSSLAIRLAPIARHIIRFGFLVHSVGRVVVVTDQNLRLLAVGLDMDAEVGLIVSTVTR